MIFTSIAIIFTSGLLFGAHVAPDRMSEVKQCIEMQTDLYGDICAESSSGYESMTGSEAHQDGLHKQNEHWCGLSICKRHV